MLPPGGGVPLVAACVSPGVPPHLTLPGDAGSMRHNRLPASVVLRPALPAAGAPGPWSVEGAATHRKWAARHTGRSERCTAAAAATDVHYSIDNCPFMFIRV